ncbi:MAG: alpha/beta fold hydrolase [Pigmentiphaga sp.]|uniref:alpha/beta fold hydrolase n=1 Tax=Pigmentiphaga sp. TaxID=1977564 RepID=UPI0029BA7725|nr:alpha/beta fold hydrolase [Pigmentiphaga sp.]MDX3906757.1 alpha/beta fold hydrolase [Pigmentiphaga sp.]
MLVYPAQAADTSTRILQGGLKGPAIVLIHGLSSRADRWVRNLDVLGAAGFRAYAMDLPGHGLAAKGGNFDYSAAGYSRWLEALLESENIDRAVVVGTSFGGLIAAHYACDFPARVAGLMAVGAIGLVPAGLERRQFTMQWLGEMSRDAVAARMRRGVADPALITEELIEEDWRINNSAGAAEAFARLADYYRDQIDDDAAAPRLAARSPRFPVKLVWGALDKSVSTDYAKAARDQIPGATLDFLDGCGHLPYWEDPETFNPLLIDFARHCLAA